MEYNKLVAVTGLSGLFELISSKSDGGIVRSLEDKSSKFVSNRLHQFSHLESIEVFTNDENVNLTEVFLAMKTNGSSLPDANNAKDVKSYFKLNTIPFLLHNFFPNKNYFHFENCLFKYF